MKVESRGGGGICEEFKDCAWLLINARSSWATSMKGGEEYLLAALRGEHECERSEESKNETSFADGLSHVAFG